MGKIIFNELASKIANIEGKKDNESVGNVREQLRITAIILANEDFFEVVKFLSGYRGKKLSDIKIKGGDSNG